MIFPVLLLLAAVSPQPDRTPAEVVQIVLAGLRHNNSPIPNAGVFTTYRFASPANHAATGPYGRFLGLVKSLEFAPLLHDYPFTLSPLEVRNDSAQQTIAIQTGRGTYAFQLTLSRQREGPWRGCWMMDGVSSVAH